MNQKFILKLSFNAQTNKALLTAAEHIEIYKKSFSNDVTL